MIDDSLGSMYSPLISHVVTFSQKKILINFVREDEIELVVMSLHLDKVPGLDCFSAFSRLWLWSFIKPEVLHAVKYFFSCYFFTRIL